MILIDAGYKGSFDKIYRYLEKWGLDTKDLYINVYKGSWLGPFARCNPAAGVIKVYPPVWVILGKSWVIAKIIMHEYGHCRSLKTCISGAPKCYFCLMYDGRSSIPRVQRVLVLPFQLLRGFNFCKRCKEKIFGGSK